MIKNIIYILAHYLLCLLIFLLIQKPVFLLYNWGKYASRYVSDIPLIYAYGLKLDASAAGYLTVIPVVIVLLSTTLPRFHAKRTLMAYDAFISFAISSVTIVDAALYPFWEFKFDATVLLYINDPKNAMASVSVGFIIIRLLVTVVLSTVLFLLFRQTTKLLSENNNFPLKRRIAQISAILVACGMIFLTIRGIGTHPLNPSKVYFSNVPFENHAAINPLFNFFYTVTKTQRFERQFDFYPEPERNRVFTNLFPKQNLSVNRLLSVRRPNVLLIVMEGCGNFIATDSTISPNLCRLANEGIRFSNFHSSSFRTDRGIVSILSGYPGQPTTSIIRFPNKIKSLPGIAKSLKAQGYSTTMVYAGDMGFFNMAAYFQTIGFERLVNEHSFPSGQRTQHWGVPDGITLNWIYNDITKRKDNHPWFTTFLALSSHEPFDVPYHRLRDKQMNSYAYFDFVIGRFVERLKKTEAWSNTLVIITSDHGNAMKSQQTPEFSHVPLYVIGGAIKGHKNIDKPVCQTDIAATLLGVFHIRHDEYTFSHDITSTTYKYPFSFTTYNNGFLFIDSTGCTVYDNDAGRVLSGENKRQERYGKIILQTLYDDLGRR